MKYYIPGINKTINNRHTRGSKTGKGIGSVILDNGMGGQSSYHSMNDYLETTNAPPPIGLGLKGLDKIRNKMQNLMIKPTLRRQNNIKFSIV